MTYLLAGQPGTWTQEAKGPTNVSDNTLTTLATISGVADGEILVAHISCRDDVVVAVFCDDASSSLMMGQAAYDIQKTATADEHLFRFKQRTGGARDFDWVVYKVVPT